MNEIKMNSYDIINKKPTRRPLCLVGASISMLILGLLLGIALIFIFDSAYWVIDLVWINGSAIADSPIYPIIICTLCGCLLSLVIWKYGKPVRPAEEMTIEADEIKHDTAKKSTGECLNDASGALIGDERAAQRPLLIRLLDFIIPFAGGGPVGVAMGLIGFIRSGCSWIKRCVLKLLANLHQITNGEDLSKKEKIILYPFAIIGGFLGTGIAVELFGMGMMIPRVEAAPMSVESILWGALLAIAGWILGSIYLVASKGARYVWKNAGKAKPFLPLACGAALGISMAFLPHAGLPGSDAYSFALLTEWSQLTPFALFATSLIRTVLIAFLLNLGWSGGPFLPLVYSAICLAFAISGITGIDEAICVAGCVAGILVSFSGMPLMGIAAFMCCPLESFPIIAVATIIASVIPRPSALKGEFSMREGKVGASASLRS